MLYDLVYIPHIVYNNTTLYIILTDFVFKLYVYIINITKTVVNNMIIHI